MVNKKSQTNCNHSLPNQALNQEPQSNRIFYHYITTHPYIRTKVLFIIIQCIFTPYKVHHTFVLDDLSSPIYRYYTTKRPSHKNERTSSSPLYL